MDHFLYCGARYGETLEAFRTQYRFDGTWEIHFFEPNPCIDEAYAIGRGTALGAPCIFHHQAVWIEDCKIQFRLQNCPRNNGRGSTVTALDSQNRFLRGGAVVMVDAIDFSEFVRGLQGNRIVIRMDIEGAEFPVLRKLIKEETIRKVSDLHIEWHQRHLKSESRSTVDELTRTITDFGVNVVEFG